MDTHTGPVHSATARAAAMSLFRQVLLEGMGKGRGEHEAVVSGESPGKEARKWPQPQEGI